MVLNWPPNKLYFKKSTAFSIKRPSFDKNLHKKKEVYT